MASRKKYPTGDERAVLSEVLPYEVPPIVSNRGFYDFLVENAVVSKAGKVSWNAGSPAIGRLLNLIVGASEREPYLPSASPHRLSQKITHPYTIPFKYSVARQGTSTRTLSICHPLEQLRMADFYGEFRSLMIYYTNRSPFSIRYPAGISRYSVTRDRLHQKLRSAWGMGVETSNAEPDNFRSYFRYETYGNIYKFYESPQMHSLEKQYSRMLRLDITRCFESIYTHSISWAVVGKNETKKNIAQRKGVENFAEKFDKAMQRLNFNETSGIIIGPEFSRIFARSEERRVGKECPV